RELWRRLREALQNDDRNYLYQLNALLATTGVSPHQFAAKVIANVQKTTPTAASAVVEGMGAANPEGNIWRLAEIPGINPDFIRALECDRKAMKDFLATASNAAFVQACGCRKYADGAYILAFTAKRADQAKSTNPGGKTQLTLGGLPLDSGAFRLRARIQPLGRRPRCRLGRKFHPGGSGASVRMIILMRVWWSTGFDGMHLCFNALTLN
ncbi:MAG: hypothetical protein DMG06_22370, partial [Acidobacteria bacterium]